MEEDPNVKNLIDCFRHEIQSQEYEILTLKLQGVGEINLFKNEIISFLFFLIISNFIRNDKRWMAILEVIGKGHKIC